MNERDNPADDTALPEELRAAYCEQRYHGDLAKVVTMAQVQPVARGKVGSRAWPIGIVWWAAGLSVAVLAVVSLGWWFAGSGEVPDNAVKTQPDSETNSQLASNPQQVDVPPEPKVDDPSPSPTPTDANPQKKNFRARLTLSRPPEADQMAATVQSRQPRVVLSSRRPVKTSFLSLPNRRVAKLRPSNLFFQARFQPLKLNRSNPNAT